MQPLEVVLVKNTASEQRVRDGLEELVRQHDLGRWLFCRRIVIDEQARVNQALPRDGQPEIVLRTGFRSPAGLLTLFIHEQLHVHLARHPASVNAAVGELRSLYPGVPVGGEEGAQSERSTSEHLLLCRLEQDILAELLDPQTLARLTAVFRYVEGSKAPPSTPLQPLSMAVTRSARTTRPEGFP